MRRAACLPVAVALGALLVILYCVDGHAKPTPLAEREGAKWTVLPGSSRVISHGRSASRDTPALAYQITPYTAEMAGGDFAFVGLETPDLSLRFGFYGLIELESERPLTSGDAGDQLILPLVGLLWRGSNGLTAALSLDSFGEHTFGERGCLEFALSLRHESEHFSGSRDGNEGRYADVPNIDNFVMPDVAVRIPLGDFNFEARAQLKYFFGRQYERSYSVGPGFDLILHWLLSDGLQPFNSTFGEYLFGTELSFEDERVRTPDNYLLRNLTGLIFPGKWGEVQVFNSLALGHGKGLLAFRREALWGFGVRVVPFE
ncbi:MAG: hypothetical protein H6718_16540 [Polyangiaceae bacterium]|nr:hypothetical protein [Polyangiaceae bacterium]